MIIISRSAIFLVFMIFMQVKNLYGNPLTTENLQMHNKTLNLESSINSNHDEFHSAQGHDLMEHKDFETASSGSLHSTLNHDELRSAQGDDLSENSIKKLTKENLNKLNQKTESEIVPLNEQNIEKRRQNIRGLIQAKEEKRVNDPQATIKIDRNHSISTRTNDKNIGYHTISLSEVLTGKPDQKAINNSMVGRKGFSYQSLINRVSKKLEQENLSDSEKNKLEQEKNNLEQEFNEHKLLVERHGQLQDDIKTFENKRVVDAQKVALFRNFRMKHNVLVPDKDSKSLSESLSGEADQKALDNRILGVHASFDLQNNEDDVRSFVSAASKSNLERAQDIQNQRLKVQKLSHDVEQARVNEATPKITEKPNRSWINIPGKLKNAVKTGIEKINIVSSTILNRNKKLSKNKRGFDFDTRSLNEAIRGKPDRLAINNRILNKFVVEDHEKLAKLNKYIEDIRAMFNSEVYKNVPDNFLSEDLRNKKLILQKELSKMLEYKKNIETFLKEHKDLNTSVTEFENERITGNIPTALFRNTRIALGIFVPKADTKSFSESLSGKADQKAIDNHLLGNNDKVSGLTVKNYVKSDLESENEHNSNIATALELEQQRNDVKIKVKNSEQKRLDDLTKSDSSSFFNVSGKVTDVLKKYTKGISFFRNSNIANGGEEDPQTRSFSEVLSGKPDDKAVENVMKGKIDPYDKEAQETYHDFSNSAKKFEDYRVLTAERTVPFRNLRMKHNFLVPDKNTRSFSERYSKTSDFLAHDNRIRGISFKREGSNSLSSKNAEQVLNEIQEQQKLMRSKQAGNEQHEIETEMERE